MEICINEKTYAFPSHSAKDTAFAFLLSLKKFVDFQSLESIKGTIMMASDILIEGLENEKVLLKGKDKAAATFTQKRLFKFNESMQKMRDREKALKYFYHFALSNEFNEK